MSSEETDTIVVDPALELPRAPSTAVPGQRYFIADDGDIDYTIIASNLEHAKQIMRDAGVEFYSDVDGLSHKLDDPESAHVEWTEITAERAAQIMCWSEDGCGEHKPLAEYALGEWFCSEY